MVHAAKFYRQTCMYLNHQVHYPSDSQQAGPMYFLTPCKCAIFRVCCEAIPRQIGGITTMHINTCSLLALPLQVNCLVDEAVNTGKGAHWRMQDLLKGGSVVILHAKHARKFWGHAHFRRKPRPFQAFLREASCPTCQSLHFRSRSLLRHA